MKYLVIITSVLLLCINIEIFGQQKENYRLVWGDEFSRDGTPDTSKWNYERGFVRNEELQWYQPENAYCRNGLLIIEGRRETKANPLYDSFSHEWRRNRKNIEYTSACLITKGKQAWQYGRFEMRARIDVSPGMWPAWWTLGIERRWPANGEIDIMEYYSGSLLANILCLGMDNKQEWHTTKIPLADLGGATWSSEFHLWRMDWTEESIALFIDGTLLNKVAVDDLVNKDGSGFNPFKQPHYMLVNLAIGGENGGDPGDTISPRLFEVDYVRVYKKE